MRLLPASFRSLLLLPALAAVSVQAAAQACTGLCLQQVSCPGAGTTTITGKVYTPNGIDPLPNVLVYIPNAPVDPFTPGVSCPVVGQPPPGAPLVGAITSVDGSFVIGNVPVGTNIPLVIQTGRWRRQLVVPTTTACADTPFITRMPKNQSEGDIPKIAVATGQVDAVECVLRKIGLDDAEFTNPAGSGRINLWLGAGSGAGASIDTTTPSETALMGDAPTLNKYDVLMLPCEGGAQARPGAEEANLIAFANAGGRVYASHYSYDWMYKSPPFSTVANWQPNLVPETLPNGIATVDISFAEGQTLAQWLQLVGATKTQGQMPIQTLRHDFDGVVAPTQSWLALNDPAHNNPIMQFVFDTPIGASANQCGRVLYNEYHVENPVGSGKGPFPVECAAGAMTPQEKLLEYSLFELTGDGGQATLTPSMLDFGSEPINFTTAAQIVVWKNNSTFASAVAQLNASGDFAITASNCSAVAAGASCQISLVFKPTAIGPRTGTLTVVAGGTSSTATLTGIGIADLTVLPAALDFGNLDVGAAASKILTVTNNATGVVPVPPLGATGDYAIASNCGASLAALASCTIKVTFVPTTTGTRGGGLTVGSTDPAYTGMAVPFTGNGVDFSIVVAPTFGAVIAGFGATMNTNTSPIAGFAAPITLSCTTNAPASLCTPSATSFTPTSAVVTPIAVTTTSRYKVVGYGGYGGTGLLWLVGALSGCLLWRRRHTSGTLLRACLVALLLAGATLGLSGCSGTSPAQNASYTPAGAYTYTLTATDGFLTHSATYTLTVTAQ